MDTEQDNKEQGQQVEKISGGKTFWIIIGTWFLFYLFISLNGGGG